MISNTRSESPTSSNEAADSVPKSLLRWGSEMIVPTGVGKAFLAFEKHLFLERAPLLVNEFYPDLSPTDCARVPVPKRVPGNCELRSGFAALPQVLQPLLTRTCVFPMRQYRTSLSAKMAQSSPLVLPEFQTSNHFARFG